MKKIFKAFYKSFILYLSITLICILSEIAFKGFENVNLINSYLPTLLIFYIPILISFLFHKKENNKLMIFKSSIISFIVSCVTLFFYYNFFAQKYFYNDSKDQSFENVFDGKLFSLGVLSFFTTLILSLILIISDKTKESFIEKIKVNHSNKYLLAIPVSAALFYSVIIYASSSSFYNAISVWGNVLPFGIILSFVSFYFLKFVYSSFLDTKRKIFIFSYYFVIILLFTIICNISVIFLTLRNVNSEIIIRSLISSIVLFTPFFLYIIVIVHFYFLKLVSNQEKEQLTQQSLESQLNYQQLKNQLSPHFLFNNINVLTSLIDENPKKAVAYSENLSHIYRYFLEQEKQDVVLVKDEIEFAESYLKLLKDRFEVGLNFTIIIDENVGEKYIVSTILQQVLENVVKHNTINETNIVDVEITSEENYLIIENNKNQKLKTVSESKKGIENIKKRIAFFTDEKVIIEDSETRFIIKLPILETV